MTDKVVVGTGEVPGEGLGLAAVTLKEVRRGMVVFDFRADRKPPVASSPPPPGDAASEELPRFEAEGSAGPLEPRLLGELLGEALALRPSRKAFGEADFSDPREPLARGSGSENAGAGGGGGGGGGEGWRPRRCSCSCCW
jgi:hypothetical protein